MQEQEKLEFSYVLENAVTDPVLMFTNPEAFEKYVEERGRARREALVEDPDLRSRIQRIHDEEMAKRMANPPALVDDYIANFGANQNARRGPTIGVDSDKETAIQSKEELARLVPLRRTGKVETPLKPPPDDKVFL